MSFSRANQVFAAEFENHLAAVHGPDDIGVYICNGIAGDFKRKRLTLRVAIVITKLLKVVDYLTIKV